MARQNRRNNPDESSPPYPSEKLLIEMVTEVTGSTVLCTSLGLAQFGGAVAKQLPAAVVHCVYLDLYRANLAAAYWGNKCHNLRISCAPDITVSAVDVVAFPFSASGEADLTRDYIQSGYQRLKNGGRMFAAIDNHRDKWLGEQLHRVFRHIERREQRQGIVYVGTKSGPLKKVKNYACEFAFRDRGRLIRAYSRPGVFSHRHIDPGARHLIEEMQVNDGAHVLDIGCGTGVVALAAAFRADNVTVHAIDSNARAVECTQRGAALNGLTNLTAELNSEGGFQGSGNYELALANPPYYASFRIARHFLEVGRSALRAGGRIRVVTKLPEWYQANMPEWFDAVSMIERKGYVVFQGVRPAL